MFHSTIINGKKGPACFWDKSWESINFEKYDVIILNNIQAFLKKNKGKEYIWIQGNTSAHRSKLTQANIRRYKIPTIPWPRYSPDLNLIEHV